MKLLLANIKLLVSQQNSAATIQKADIAPHEAFTCKHKAISKPTK